MCLLDILMDSADCGGLNILNIELHWPGEGYQTLCQGFDNTEYPAKMTSTIMCVRIMTKCGRNGKIFLELCLIFGGVSSVGISDIFAKIVLFIVLIQS